MKAIFRREFVSYYQTPQGYVFSGAFILVMNLYFYFTNIQGLDSDLGAAFSFMLTVLMLTVPVLTMRLFAEEFRQGTDRLLFTAPLPLRHIVLGKFMSAMAAFGVTLLITVVWAEIIALFGSLNVAEYIGHMIAILTFAAVYISLGLLISALTSSQTVAMIATLGTFAALFLLDVAAGVLPDAPLTRFLNACSLFKRYDAFARGVFSLVDIIFCVTACAFFLFVTTLVLHRRRQGVKGQRLKLLTLIVPSLVVMIAVNLLATGLEQRFYLRYDMTRSGLFTLSEETVNVLDKLPIPVTVTLLCQPSELSGLVVDDESGAAYQLSDVREALEKYAAFAPRNFTLQYIDPNLNPTWVKERQTGNNLGLYSIVVESERRIHVMQVRDLFESQTMYDPDGNPIQEAVVGLAAEQAMTSAILHVVTEKLPRAVVIEGHEEYPLPLLSETLSQVGFACEPANLSAAPIPNDTALLILAAPQYDFSAVELERLDMYLSNGGQAIVALDPAIPVLPNLELYLTEWGVRYESAYVLDAQLNYGSPDTLLPTFLDNYITKDLIVTNRYLLIAGARPIDVLWETDGARVTTPLFSSFDTAYAKDLTTGAPLTSLEQTKDDKQGPFTLGVATEQVREDGTGSFVFFLPLSTLDDQVLTLPNFINQKLVLHLARLVEPYLTVDVPPRDLTSVPLAINSREILMLLLLLVVILPLCVFGGGVIVWLKRRSL